MTPLAMVKYPRTPHLEGSRLQPGDEDLAAVPFAAIAGRHLCVEEKIDGANAGVRFDEAGALHLSSRGHFLRGGGREKHFALFKQWAECHRAALFAALGARHALYGEWVYAKHTVFYDRLPHYFLEFDVLDTVTGRFLSTPARRALLAGAPIVSVPVLWEGRPRAIGDVTRHVGRALHKSDGWRDALADAARREGVEPDRALRETDPTDAAEGLYLKVEEDGAVVARLKYVRASFLTAVVDSGSHWLARPVIPNALAPGVDLFAAVAP